MSQQRELSVGIIGLGHLHPRSYMPLFEANPTTRVTAVSEADDVLRDAFTADFGVRGFSHWREMLDAVTMDLAYIFLPHCDCPEAAVACAQAGVHVVVEKPVAHASSAASQVGQACRDEGVLFSTPYLWRYHPVCRRMKEIIDAGFLGKIVGCEGRCAAGGLHRYIEGNAAWMLEKAKSGGGPMYNLGVHWIDLYRWLLGSEVREVTGRNVRINEAYDVEDNSFALLTFASGATLALDISYTVPDSYPYGRDLYLSIRGTEGCVNFAPSFEGTRQTLFVCSNHPDFGGAPRQTIEFELDPVPGYCGSMGLEYVGDIAANIIDGKSPLIGAEDAVKALEAVEAVYESAQSGKVVVIG